jgi:hypothetical protein
MNLIFPLQRFEVEIAVGEKKNKLLTSKSKQPYTTHMIFNKLCGVT